LSYSVHYDLSFPIGDARQYGAAFGFGLFRHPPYMVARTNFETPPCGTLFISGASSVMLTGWGVIVPFWFPMLVTAALGAVLWREKPWRFSTRGLFIAVTVICVVLGLAAALDTPPKNWELDQPVPLDDV
jgi:hypothetical protein